MPWTAEPHNRGPTRKTKDVALVQPGDGRDPEKDPFAQGPALHLMSPAAARALAAELVRAADEVEPGTEAGEHRCPNCHKRRDFIPVLDDHNGDTGTLECDECGWIIEAPKENAHV